MAYPDPPFNGMGADEGGLDIDVVTANAHRLQSTIDLIPYTGDVFNGTFDELGSGRYDCVIAGTTVTSERQSMADFAPAYLVSGQSLAIDRHRAAPVRALDGGP